MGPDSLAVHCVRCIVRNIEQPTLWNAAGVRSLAQLPEELVQIILSQVIAAGRLRSLAVLRLFLDSKHASVIAWLQSQDLHHFEMRSRGIGLHQKGA
jgi:hypothetical protein